MRFIQVLVITAAVLWFGRAVSLSSLFADWRSARFHLMAGALLAVNWTTYVYAVSHDQVIEASLGYFINPLMSIVLGIVVLSESIDRVTWAAIAVVSLGVAIISIEAGSLPWISLLLAVSFAAYGLLKKQSTLGPIEGLALEMAWMVPLATIYLGWQVAQGVLTFGDSPLWVLGIGVITASPLLLFGRAAKAIPLWAVGLIQFLAPSLSFALGALVFDEPVSNMRLAGFVVIWLGLALSVSKRIPGLPIARLGRANVAA